jgi:type IV secretory pathway VirB10-like protein
MQQIDDGADESGGELRCLALRALSMKPALHRRSRAVLLAALLAAVSSDAARAQEPDLAALRARIEQLQSEIDALRARMETLEASHAVAPRASPPPPSVESRADAPPTPPAATAALARSMENWPRIEAGLSRDEVQTLLGAPSHELSIDGKLVWYYVYPRLGRGSVFFNSRGRVSSAQSPRPMW